MSQSLGSGVTIASGAISTTGKLTQIKASGLYGSGNHVSLFQLLVGGVSVEVFNNVSAFGASTTSWGLDCELQTTGSNTVRASCTSGLGENQAGPYFNITDNSITLSGTLLVQIVVTTDGTAAAITQDMLLVRAENY
jgi:hypothetical protein